MPVADPDALAHLVAALALAPVVAVDTESNSLHAYRERVCLIQISTSDADYIVDPIALPDLSALGPVMANPRQLWVANYYSARNPLRLSSLVILGVVARMFRCATRSSCWCT